MPPKRSSGRGGRTPASRRRPVQPKDVVADAHDVTILAALLSGATIAAAAHLAGISRSAVERRLLDPEFRRRIEEERTDKVRSVLDKVNAEAYKSVEALVEIRDNPAAAWASRVRASVEILKLAMGTPDIEINQTTIVGGPGGPDPAEQLRTFLGKLHQRSEDLAGALPAAPIDVESTET
jgi:hypothetical protein